MSTPAALGNLRVLDFTRVLAGPFCTMLLGDFGAEVIKVENPKQGDDTRAWGPPWAGEGDSERPDRLSAYYLSVNRNKYSLTLNLKTSEGQAIARALSLKSDVLVENFKVGQMRDYQLDYKSLRANHPALIYCSITGYGQSSPYAQQPGYDYLVQGQSGLMSITGPPDGPPYKVGVAVADVITGLFAANAIQAALYHRAQTGQGQYIDVALLDSQIAALVNVASNYLVSRVPPSRYGNAHASIVPYEAFQASDGYFILNVGNDDQFRRCCGVIERPTLAADPRFATNPARVQNRDELTAILKATFARRPAREWIAIFQAVGVPAGPINDIPAVFDDPHVRARGLVTPVKLPNGQQIDLLGPTLQLSETPPGIRRPPPALGQDTEAILRDLVGLDQTTINDYRQRGII